MPRTLTALSLWIFFLALHGPCAVLTLDLVTDCPLYVLEGGRLECTCNTVNEGGTGAVVTWSPQSGQSRLSLLVMDNVQRADNGTVFTCTGTDGGVTQTLTYILLVACSPKHPNDDFSQFNQEFPPELTEGGLLFDLEANPIPTTFTFTFHGTSSSNTGQPFTKDSFSAACAENADEAYLVMCEMKILIVTEDDFGVYSIRVTNEFGSFDYYFAVSVAVDSPEPVLNCPVYVSEGERLECPCISTNVGNTVPTLTWLGQPGQPGQTGHSILVKDNVQAADNGTQFTCTLTADDVTKTVVYTLQVAYGPAVEHTTIIGPGNFATDGSKTMTLTCLVSEVNPEPTYFWDGVTCEGGNRLSTCSFEPQAPQDDGLAVTCTATSGYNGIDTASAVFSLRLQYPPTSSPVISGFTPGQVLRTGDNITCSVAGGKPRVSSVDFRCSNPDLPDKADVIVGEAVASSVTVDASQATDSDAVCVCRAVWAPEQDLYQLTTTESVSLEYKASVVNFTLNGLSNRLTVDESSLAHVDLQCTARGRPVPDIILTTQDDAILLRHAQNTDSLTFRISHVTCERMGTYVCTAENGFSNPSQMSAKLKVNCAPRETNNGFSQDNQASPPELTENGLTFEMISHPAPRPVAYSLHQSSSSSALTRDMFATRCRKSRDRAYISVCDVRARDVNEGDVGLYSVVVSNGIGNFRYYFRVERPVVAPSTTSPPGGFTVSGTSPASFTSQRTTSNNGLASGFKSDSGGGPSAAAVAGGVIAGLVVVAAVVAIVVYIKLKGSRASKYTSSQTENGGNQMNGLQMDSNQARTELIYDNNNLDQGHDNPAMTDDNYEPLQEPLEGDTQTAPSATQEDLSINIEM